MSEIQTLAKVVFGPHGTVSKKELKNLYKASSTRDVRRELKSSAPKVGWSGIWGLVRTHFPDLFRIPVTDILLYGWDKFQQVGEALHPDQQGADERIQIPLHERTFVSEHHPRIELYYRDKKVFELPFQFILKLHFESLMLVFQNGELRELRPGRCESEAELQLKKRTILKRRLQKIELPGSIMLNRLERDKGGESPDQRAGSGTIAGTGPQLPPARRKRGVGCFLLIMFLSIGIVGGLWALQNLSALLRWLRHF